MDLPKLPRGEGSMSYLPDRDEILYRKTLKDSDGKTHRISVYAKTPRECIGKMRVKELDIINGVKKAENATLLDKMLWWCENVHKPTVKPQTNDRVRKTIINQIGKSNIARRPYNKVKAEDIQALINDLNTNGYSYSVIKKIYDALRSFYTYLYKLYKQVNPMDFVVVPRRSNVKTEAKKVTWFEQEDIEKFCSACDARWNTGNLRFKYGYALAANIYLGLRVGELLALTWNDVDFDKNTISVWKTVVEMNNPNYNREDSDSKKVMFVVQESTKTNHRRIVPMNNMAKKYLLLHYENATYKELDDYVISTQNRKINTAKNISDMIKAIEKYAEMDVQDFNTHILRHTCASLYFKKGVPVEVIAKILGNSREVCEQTYVHLAEEQLKIASAKLNEELLTF